MNLVLIFALGIIALSPIFLMDAYGLTDNNNISYPSLIEVSLQIQVRDSEGRLVAYFEPNLMYIKNLAKLHERLDTIENKEKILINGVEHELIKFHQVGRNLEKYRDQISSFYLFHQDMPVLVYNHDGYLRDPGDVWTTDWKIIRTIS